METVEDSNSSESATSMHVKAVGVDVHEDTNVLETGPARRRTLLCVLRRRARGGLRRHLQPPAYDDTPLPPCPGADADRPPCRRDRYVLNPAGQFMRLWDVAVLVALMYTASAYIACAPRESHRRLLTQRAPPPLSLRASGGGV